MFGSLILALGLLACDTVSDHCERPAPVVETSAPAQLAATSMAALQAPSAH